MFALFSENGLCGDEIILRAGSANKIAADLLEKNDLMFVAESCKTRGNNDKQLGLEKISQLIVKTNANIVERSDIESFSFELLGGVFKFLKCAETENEISDFADYVIKLKKDKNNHILLSADEIDELSQKLKLSINNKDIYDDLCSEISKEQYL